MKAKKIILQRYIKDPVLFKSRKMDLRYYLIVTHINAKIEYEVIEGFGRLAQSPYSEASLKVR